MPLEELEEGEQLCSLGSSLQTSDFELQTWTVLSATLVRANTAVYNIEVHGEHVYQVGELGVLVHNACIDKVIDIRYLKPSSARDFADPAKLARLGEFNWNLYKPIEVVKSGSGYQIMDGMTRVDAALRAGITKLPAKIFLP